MSTLIVMRSTPYGNTNAKDALDIALILATFEQSPSLLYQGAGLQQLLLHSQHTTPFKHIGNILKAFPIYDIEQIYIDKASINEQNISLDKLNDLPVEYKLLDTNQVTELMYNHQHIMVF
jgi:tRNA 2-thiouridine synthesizing protein C